MMATSKCSITGCNDPVIAFGWCRKHYTRWYRHKDINVNLNRKKTKTFVRNKPLALTVCSCGGKFYTNTENTKCVRCVEYKYKRTTFALAKREEKLLEETTA